jgi:hypothetical protein
MFRSSFAEVFYCRRRIHKSDSGEQRGELQECDHTVLKWNMGLLRFVWVS